MKCPQNREEKTVVGPSIQLTHDSLFQSELDVYCDLEALFNSLLQLFLL